MSGANPESRDVLPSSVPRETRDIVFGEHDFVDGKIAWIPVFCASCCKRGPRVPEVQIQSGGYVCWLCDGCAEKLGPQTDLMLVPEEVFWAKFEQAQIEKYGRTLEPFELELQLGDPNSFASKLARELDQVRKHGRAT